MSPSPRRAIAASGVPAASAVPASAVPAASSTPAPSISARAANAALTLLLSVFAFAPHAATATPVSSVGINTWAIRFGDADYLHRSSKAGRQEFTPRGQEDLNKATDLLTINYFRSILDGDGLAATANAVLENYKANRARVVRINSIPRTPTQPSEHLIVVMFGTPTYVQVDFARFKLVDGIGLSVVYSHREYGANVGERAGAWLEKFGPAAETVLMGLTSLPVVRETSG